MLKEYRGPRSPKLFTGSNLPQSLQPRPAAILAKRTLVGQTGSRTEVLVDWEGLPREESTWEEWSKLVQLFPEVDLEGKVVLEGGLLIRTQVPLKMKKAQWCPTQQHQQKNHQQKQRTWAKMRKWVTAQEEVTVLGVFQFGLRTIALDGASSRELFQGADLAVSYVV